MGLQSLVNVKNLTKKFGKKIVLEGVNLKINAGDRIALLAPNGYGKTTFVNLLCQLNRQTSGEIVYLGGKSEFLRTVGVQFQIGKYPPGIRVVDLIYFYTNIYNTKVDKTLKRAFRIDEIEKLDFNDLSFGQQKRVELFLVLTTKAKFVILDEITAGMDIYVKHTILNMIEKYLLQKHITLLYISHNLGEINRLCTRVVLIKDHKFWEEKRNVKTLDLETLMKKTYGWKI